MWILLLEKQSFFHSDSYLYKAQLSIILFYKFIKLFYLLEGLLHQFVL